MILAVAMTLMLQDPAPEYGVQADRLSERLQWITTTLRELREKRRVHAEALAEVEAYLETITRRGSDLQAKGRQLDEMKRNLAVKTKEHAAIETEYENEQKLYNQQLERWRARQKELKERWDRLDADIKAHNARQNQVTQEEAEAYRQNAERLNGIKAQLTTESNQSDNGDRAVVQSAYDKLERMRLNEDAVEGVKIDLSNDLRWDSNDFNRALKSMEGPAEALHSLLLEATGQRTASTAFRVHATRREATAQSLADAFGGGLDLPDTMLAEVYIIRPGRDRGTTREYIVERLRLGELIEGIRALTPEMSDKAVAADRALENSALAAAAGKPCALVKGAAWTMKPPEASTVKPRRGPGLKGS